jgi:formate/nitrite transporter
VASDGPRSDARAPADIALEVERVGVAKARLRGLPLLALSVLAGAFIAIGALLFLVVVTDPRLGWGVSRLVGGLAFSLGLVLVVVAGAELFTGNNLVAMAWASGLVGTGELVRHWLLVYLGNVVGALATLGLVLVAGTAALGEGGVGTTALELAGAKTALPAAQVFARGVLCNALVCLAVWLAMAGRSVADKVLAVPLPIAAFVALGFEHSIANWFFLPYAWALDGRAIVPLTAVLQNLAASTAGNLVGGTLLVAAVYWVAYLRAGR